MEVRKLVQSSKQAATNAILKAISDIEIAIADEKQQIETFTRSKEANIQRLSNLIQTLTREIEVIKTQEFDDRLSKVVSKVVRKSAPETQSDLIRRASQRFIEEAGGSVEKSKLMSLIIANIELSSKDPIQLVRRALSRDSRFYANGNRYTFND